MCSLNRNGSIFRRIFRTIYDSVPTGNIAYFPIQLFDYGLRDKENILMLLLDAEINIYNGIINYYRYNDKRKQSF